MVVNNSYKFCFLLLSVENQTIICNYYRCSIKIPKIMVFFNNRLNLELGHVNF